MAAGQQPGRHVMETQPQTDQAVAGKYLTFKLARGEYGLPVLKVREIIKLMTITEVPQAPPYFKGVLNLRGRVIPVLDLRAKLGLAAVEATDQTCVIVVDVQFEAKQATVGLIVDAVCEVANITGQECDQAPDFGERTDTEYILGLAKVKDAVKILIDLDRVLGADACLVAPLT
jgi:purine-binding chemotaxis protein CheW